jgi:sulfate permease, SulP family
MLSSQLFVPSVVPSVAGSGHDTTQAAAQGVRLNDQPERQTRRALPGLQRIIPAIGWLSRYRREDLLDDLTAGVVTAILLVPQGMAFALLAGLPPEVGLYASVAPPIIYALLGSSRTLSVGPVSVAALLVAHALGAAGLAPSDPRYLADALLLAAMTGTILLLMAALRLGMLVNFLGHPVLSGFVSGAAILIILSQLQNLLGLPRPPAGSSLAISAHYVEHAGALHGPTALIGLGSGALLLLLRSPLLRLLEWAGVGAGTAGIASRVGPLAVVALAVALVAGLDLDRQGVAIVGEIPGGLPAPSLAFIDFDRVAGLLPAALMIALIGYVESISVAKALAFRRRQKIGNDQELVALGAANLAAAVVGGMPVAGGFSRSMVNFAAGARTQLAAIVTAVLVGATALFFTPLFHHLPQATLAAIIIVAVSALIDWRMAGRTWRYDRADAAALVATFAGVLVFDIEIGLLIGLAVSIGAFLGRSSRPHIAIVGRIAGTEHYRNVERHRVETWPELLLLRVDRSLFFANINRVEDVVAAAAAAQPRLQHLVLICSAINTIDHSAVESLEQLSDSLAEAGVTLHLAEVRGPVMDRLERSDLLERIRPGRVFLSTEDAVRDLAGPSRENGEAG